MCGATDGPCFFFDVSRKKVKKRARVSTHHVDKKVEKKKEGTKEGVLGAGKKGGNLEREPPFGDGTGGDPADGLSGRRTATARRRLDAILGQIGIVGVRRPRYVGHLRIVGGVVVLVGDIEADGRAQREPVFRSRLDLDLVGLVARRRERALAGPAAVQLRLDVGLGQAHT